MPGEYPGPSGGADRQACPFASPEAVAQDLEFLLLMKNWS